MKLKRKTLIGFFYGETVIIPVYLGTYVTSEDKKVLLTIKGTFYNTINT